MSTTKRQVVVQRLIAAPRAEIFEILADPHSHAMIDGSGAVGLPRSGTPGRLYLGAEFDVRMRIVPTELHASALLQTTIALANCGSVTNTVVEFEEPHRIAWRNFGMHVWRYELEPGSAAATETLVRQTFDYSTNLLPQLIEIVGFPERNRRAMLDTLDRLAARCADAGSLR